MTEKEKLIIHPRPSSIVASLYTLRDLNVDVAILHGPPGCSFKHARLLEEDRLRVLTSAMDENDFVFGGREKLERTIDKAIELFSPKTIALVGTCTSMIIGEELTDSAAYAPDGVDVICVETHAGYANNTDGVISVLEPAMECGMITAEELERQRRLLTEATNVEIRHGAASKGYLAPSRGDIKYKAAEKLIELIRSGKKIVGILNAKKETAYMFADELIALYETARLFGMEENITIFSNTDITLGLPRVKEHAVNVMKAFDEQSVPVHEIIGGLDEYAVTAGNVKDLILNKYGGFDVAVIAGVPHALPMEAFAGMELFSITNGPRQVAPLKDMGHQHVMVEIDLHPQTLGVTKIVPSEFGDTLRAVATDVMAAEIGEKK
ncbi:Ni-sirohydrochlorin a,c-diamide reductive cyclase catalytic subunit [Methanimicrococcus blatticola]|uniref:Putative methanogenesis marker 13 metalloprotein n=1 Tax=Methanimicrococcus blatticola TaxID=91560 RepID=A0A484F768_9EURY|nr:Ni-sirohydrochlorin a,c-diamide reductive cyclase catalytic subunit [Methanimicrococcus blatticola]MBZ3935242.1 Ni-sirohydrochlorin a,c-diamide reductive cyclase catalytic subunit [Methanimicrococcus blatticola]MCC2508660.1 Ni-sirohydrochlorin a,c-diamide reductive cyclase catalytic subunit [Methanimicrococcus blatticola]TDQ71303.1 putative methanogenesis marker 13 metalloprotein [Methanimicrococcus blatticola]